MFKIQNKLHEKVLRAMIEVYNDLDARVRKITFEEVIADPRHGMLQAAWTAIQVVEDYYDLEKKVDLL